MGYLIFTHAIPRSLVINMDQTGIHVQPSASYSRAEKSTKHVAVIGTDSKRQLTLVPSVAASGHALPFQVIYQGKTDACLPPLSVRKRDNVKDMVFSYSNNHWSNLDTNTLWVDNILVPYIKATCERDGLVFGEQAALLLIDCWPVHRTDAHAAMLG